VLAIIILFFLYSLVLFSIFFKGETKMDEAYIELRFKTEDANKIALLRNFVERIQRLEIIDESSYQHHFTLILSGGNEETPNLLTDQSTRLDMENASARRMSVDETLEWKVNAAHWRNMVACSTPRGRSRGEG